MYFKDLIKNIDIINTYGTDNVLVKKLEIDSRKVEKNTMFFAVKGTVVDAHQYISGVIEMGASAIVCSELPTEINAHVAYVLVKDVQQVIGYFASNFYSAPSEKMKLIGVTGTNGKTTTTTMLYQLFTALGHTCGLISTVEYIIGKETFTSTHTTPNPIRINELMAEMVDAGCSYCFMEVSSHAIVQGRINGLQFDGASFTNITHDHLDYHITFDNYIKAKKLFFDNLSSDAFALVNKDDKNGNIMLQNTKASRYTFALKSSADFQCKIIESDFNGLLLKMDTLEAWFGMVGKFNAYNLLAVYGTAFLLGVSQQEIITKLTLQGRVNGRFEVYKSSKGVVGIVDYAHTPDALVNVLDTINNIRTKNEQLITVLGCGGDRDKTKRPVMGKVATQLSDKVIFTSDNPRSENPDSIIGEMYDGVEAINYKKTLKIADRKEAIKTAIMMSNPKDIILIAGKGHETYQEINGVKYPFDDRLILTEIFNQTI